MTSIAKCACIALLLSACAQDDGQDGPEPAPAAGRDTPRNNVSELRVSDTASWTAGTVVKPSEGEVATLLNVRVASHADYERIVFDFGPGALPGYKMEYVDRPVRQCGSGEVVELPGDAWLLVHIEPAHAHTEAGEPTVRQRDLRPNFANLKQLKLICDFEAVVEWVAAVGTPSRFRTLELRDPTRLVLDIRKR